MAAPNRVGEFEKAYSDHLRANHADLLETLRTDKKWTSELATQFDGICADFAKEFIA